MAHTKQGRSACPSFSIVDAQGVKNTDTAGQKGYEAGKKVSGIKRHIALTTAELTDCERALCSRSGMAKPIWSTCYVGQPFAKGVQEILGKHVTVQIAKRCELHTFAVIPKRWVVERNFAWLEKNRRLWKNGGHQLAVYLPGFPGSLTSKMVYKSCTYRVQAKTCILSHMVHKQNVNFWHKKLNLGIFWHGASPC